jgi:hypothetical protein
MPERSADQFHKVCLKCAGNSKPREPDVNTGQSRVPPNMLVVDMNVSAALCLTRMFVFMLAEGRRPQVFMTSTEVRDMRRRQETVILS